MMSSSFAGGRRGGVGVACAALTGRGTRRGACRRHSARSCASVRRRRPPPHGTAVTRLVTASPGMTATPRGPGNGFRQGPRGRGGWCRGHRPRRASIRPPSAGPRRGDPPAGVPRPAPSAARACDHGELRQRDPGFPHDDPHAKMVREHRIQTELIARTVAAMRVPDLRGAAPCVGGTPIRKAGISKDLEPMGKWRRIPGIRPDSPVFPGGSGGAGAVRRGRGTDAEVPVRPGQTVAAWGPG